VRHVFELAPLNLLLLPFQLLGPPVAAAGAIGRELASFIEAASNSLRRGRGGNGAADQDRGDSDSNDKAAGLLDAISQPMTPSVAPAGRSRNHRCRSCQCLSGPLYSLARAINIVSGGIVKDSLEAESSLRSRFRPPWRRLPTEVEVSWKYFGRRSLYLESSIQLLPPIVVKFGALTKASEVSAVNQQPAGSNRFHLVRKRVQGKCKYGCCSRRRRRIANLEDDSSPYTVFGGDKRRKAAARPALSLSNPRSYNTLFVHTPAAVEANGFFGGSRLEREQRLMRSKAMTQQEAAQLLHRDEVAGGRGVSDVVVSEGGASLRHQLTNSDHLSDVSVGFIVQAVTEDDGDRLFQPIEFKRPEALRAIASLELYNYLQVTEEEQEIFSTTNLHERWRVTRSSEVEESAVNQIKQLSEEIARLRKDSIRTS
jgi:hypothetical protein